ncbi:exocyst complex component 3-like protein 4 isoform 2-T3 [Clarias gariepinus]|uniref:exocyst complex component 3-like protein 4 isoform X2 n=1 Tax=Clarias gariepinus TaxID=13013 RepID=UPI00234DBFBD|nr:exocyst complex component 3-like protein 4 isoform X2 [Clarias gariepinus]
MADSVSGEADRRSDISACTEDRTEMAENNKTQINVKKKKKNSIIKSVKGSFLSPKNKEADNKTKRTNTENDLGNSLDDPQSPSSPMESPLTQQESLRQKLRFGSKKKNLPKQEHIEACKEGLIIPEEEKSEATRSTADEVLKLYVLPEIPPIPLSVMQINNLIKDNILEKAYVNILSLREEVQCEKEALAGNDSPGELLNKEKDLSMLYNNLRDKLTEIVQQSSAQPSFNKELLVQMSGIIQEEEKREGDAGKMGGWRDVWRAAIQRGVKETLEKIHLDSHEQNVSWLAIHLGQVGKVIVEQLEKVKAELTSSYPPSFNVFETYVSSFHKAVAEHLKVLLGKVTEVKDYYALLDFILKRYHSEKIMGSKSLQPELKEELKTLKLEDDFLGQIKKAYCNCLKADVRSTLDSIIKLENDEMWKEQNKPQINEDLYISHIHMDILMYIKGPIQASSLLDVELEQKVMCCCLDELKKFPKRFESAFVQWNKTLLDPSLWAEYHITYINSFRDLKEQIEIYRQKCPSEVEELCKELHELINLLSQAFLEHFKTDTKPHLRLMITREWLRSEENFQQLHKKIEILSQQCKHLSPNHAPNSVQNWLYPVGDHMQKIIGEKKKSEIQAYLEPLVNDYPDFSQKHLSAILYFRGVKRGRKRRMILQKLSDLKQHDRNTGSKEHALFSQMETAVNTDCLANVPVCSLL